MFISLAPLALLTIINNFSFQMPNKGEGNCICEFICLNLPLLCVMLLCIIWILLSIKYYFWDFGLFCWKNGITGYEIKNVEEDKEASLNFFLTLIIPLLLDNVSTIQGAVTFLVVMVIICLLLYRTNLFFANPILTLLGFHLYSFEFVGNNNKVKKKYLGLCKGQVPVKKMIGYKDITEDVLFIKGM